MDMSAIKDTLQGGLDGALYIAGAALAAVVSIYALKHIARAITMPRW